MHDHDPRPHHQSLHRQVHRRRSGRRHRPPGQARDRHGRLVAHRHRDRSPTRLRRRRRHPRRAQPRRRGSRRRRDQRQPRWRARHRRSPRPHRPRLSPQLRPAVELDTPTHARQQRRRHGRPTRPHPYRIGVAARHQPPRALRPGHRATRCPSRCQQRTDRLSQLPGPSLSEVDLDDINFNRRDYDPWLGYGQSKTANVLFAVEAT